MTIAHVAPVRANVTQPIDHVDDARRAELRQKYLEERDKRVRKDGIHQFRELKGSLRLADDDDPYTEVKPREPVTDHVEFLFLGGGFAGLTVCARLKQAGITGIRILDSGGDFGGVWYWNR
jgi:cyclohexanone monooxygenase